MTSAPLSAAQFRSSLPRTSVIILFQVYRTCRLTDVKTGMFWTKKILLSVSKLPRCFISHLSVGVLQESLFQLKYCWREPHRARLHCTKNATFWLLQLLDCGMVIRQSELDKPRYLCSDSFLRDDSCMIFALQQNDSSSSLLCWHAKKNSEVQSVIGIQNSISRQSSWPRKKPVSNNLIVCNNRG